MSVLSNVDPEDWIAHNRLAFAIRDRYPVSEGHALVVPKRLIGRWWDTTPDERAAIAELIETVKRRLDVEFAPDGYNVGFNDGAAAGQTVDHLHVHVIPRYTGDIPDPRGGIRHVIPGRGNYLLTDRTSDPALTSPTAWPAVDVDVSPATLLAPEPTSLVTPFDGRLKLELIRCLIRPDLDQIDLLVSFVMRSGVDLIAAHLDDALARGARVRLLTTDYLQVTETSALGFFLDRLDTAEPGTLDARVFSDPTTSFHPKAYLFSSAAGGTGVAFIGSSNLSRSGITTGVEWNITTHEVSGLRREFDRLWDDPRSITLTEPWLRKYDAIRQARRADNAAVPSIEPVDETDLDAVAFADEEDTPAPRPWRVQADALAALVATRHDGHDAGLVVMATGLGKTWLAAFDSTRPEFRRVLFVAHRDEILGQSRDVFRQVRPGGSLSRFDGGHREHGGDVVFASVQSLARHLADFEPDAFDYIVVDEFHHAAATSYRRVLAHFRPRFLLGLTATPDRADAADLLALCGDNLVFDCGLVSGIEQGLLSPFAYRAIPDTADYTHIPWRSGRFDSEALTTELATIKRAEQVYDEWLNRGGATRRTLGFCCTIAHAEFMAEMFRAQGVAAVAVHSGAASAPRAASLERLINGEVSVVFTVDLFNEGVDVPSIDLVLLLRPTESPVVFFQQLGRGLRRHDGKACLDVIDLVGNHRSFLLKARLLAQLAGRAHLTDREAVQFLADGRERLANDADELPDGCSIIIDPIVVDLLRELAGPARHDDRILELVRAWIDAHEQRRPTALELSLVTHKPFNLKAQGGWFGFLAARGLLDAPEARTVAIAGDFFKWIEHGNYTKSYKLVTLAALTRSGRLRSGMNLTELAAACRWDVLRDRDLRSELDDATSSFADVGAPTPDEWLRYWRKNPIAAMTTATRGADPWFDVVDESMCLRLAVPDELGATLESMVLELVDYRMHRYLAGRRALVVGERRQPSLGGESIDATFVIESEGHLPRSLVFESAGGTKGSASARNLDYVQGFDLVLQRLRDVGTQILDIAVDTTRTVDLALADRRLDPGDELRFPFRLDDVPDLVALRKHLLHKMGRVGQSPEAKTGGNSRKRFRLTIAVDDSWSPAALADAVATGDLPPSPGSALTHRDQGTGA